MFSYIYDIETMPNVFTLAVELAEAPFKWLFEISDFKNDSEQIIEFIQYIKNSGGRMVGFNNLAFDYPILHTLILTRKITADVLYKKAQSIISNQDEDNKFINYIPSSDRFVPQIDLYKIHHFDNKARATGLKVLEFNMKSKSIKDFPFAIGTILNFEQIELLKIYNQHDVSETKKFYFYSVEMLKFREELSKKYNRDFMNHNDTKIGKDYFAMELEKSKVQLYTYTPNGRIPTQTKRDLIHLSEAILPWIKFKTEELNRVLNWLKRQSITETKGVFKDLTATVKGFEFVFGLGGIHGSVESKCISSDDDYVIIDLDVASYYPNLAIQNKFYPEHLGQTFCVIYKRLYEQRKQYPKKSAENAMLKLALNGVYGDSNNKFSIFYDPLFTMKITLNGQLLLCLLSEKLFTIDELEIIQVNTDGVTVRLPRNKEIDLTTICKEWEQLTGLQLEKSVYQDMFIRDCNNYIAVYSNGKLKRKGAYEHNVEWYKDHSALVIPKVAELVLTQNKPIRETVKSWTDIYDFLICTKVPRKSYLVIEKDNENIKIQNISRYVVSKKGGQLFKWMPPLQKSPTEWRKIAINAGWNVSICNDLDDLMGVEIDFEYYIREIEKLCLGIT